MSILDAYLQRVSGYEGDAPSGQKFQWRIATTADQAAAFDGMPSLTTIKAGEFTIETMKRARKFNGALLAACVTHPRIILNGEDPGEDGLPYDRMTSEDAEWLVERIQSRNKLDGDKAKTARGVL